jgi:hypothetical protein
MCGVEYPVSRFPNLSLGIVCEACINGQVATGVDEALVKKTTAMAKQIMSVDSSEVLAAMPKLKGILAGVYREFGGPEGFAQHFFWVLKELSNRRPLPATVGSLMLGFMKLHHSLENAEENVAARDMTDEQIRREMELEMMRLIMDSSGDPEKRKMLERVLGANGLKLENAGVLDVVNASVDEPVVTSETLEAEIAKFNKFGD